MRNPSKSVSEAEAKKKNNNNNNDGSSSTINVVNSSKTTPCCMKVGLKRGPWTPEEDEVLSNYIEKEGEGRWRTLPKRAGLLRCGKSCRLRWMNYLRPSVKRGHIAPDEEDLILRLHRLLGNRWSLIAGRIPGRTDNEIKNYWNTHLSKKLISQGIDPRSHRPLNPHNNCDHDDPINYPTSCIIANHKAPAAVPASCSKNIQYNIDHDYMETEKEEAANHNNHSSQQIDKDDDHEEVQYGYANHVVGNEEDIQDMNNYCTDQVFSSFLNSLINEDAFAAHQNISNSIGISALLPQHDHHVASPFYDHMHQLIPNGVAVATTTTVPHQFSPYALDRESAFMSSTLNHQNDPNKSSHSINK